jgi:glycosyltransferase involved in cell wall biosynthesis
MGFPVPSRPKDLQALAQAVRQLWEHQDLREKLGQQRRDLVVQKFPLERIAARV